MTDVHWDYGTAICGHPLSSCMCESCECYPCRYDD